MSLSLKSGDGLVGFADFKDGKPFSEEIHKACFSCHILAKDHDFVFAHYAP